MTDTTNLVGSSGSLVATTLETLGYYYQSYILSEIGDIITGPAGMLIYTIGAIVAITGFMMTGRYKMALWFFLGPGIFVAVLSTRTETNGTDWLFGLDPRPRGEVSLQVNGVLNRQGMETGHSANVSSLFAEFNRITSRVVQELVRVLNNGRDKADLRFILRSELAGFMETQTPMDTGLRELLHFALLRNCGKFIEAARESEDPRHPNELRQSYRDLFYQLRDNKDVQLNPAGVDWIATQIMAGRSVAGVNATADSSLPVSDSYLGNKDELKTHISEQRFSCAEIWQIVYDASIDHAERVIDSSRALMAANGISDPEARRIDQDFARMNGIKGAASLATPVSTDTLVKAVALYTLRNEMNTKSGAAFLDDYASRGRKQNLQTPSGMDLAQVERGKTLSKEWSEKTRAMTTASSLPYYQGVGLLILSIAFPFFALLLLVPGKHAGFVLWFQLWVWLKSWDIGFAVVMMLDDLLFSIMGTGPAVAPHNVQLSADVAQAMFTLQEMDPTFQLGTYYTLIAVALQSIPLISAYLIMGSASAGASLIAQGMQGYTDDLSSGAASAQGQYVIDGQRYEAIRDEVAAVEQGIFNANTGQAAPGVERPHGVMKRGEFRDYNSSYGLEGDRIYAADPKKRRPMLNYSSSNAEELAENVASMRWWSGLLRGAAYGSGDNDSRNNLLKRQSKKNIDMIDFAQRAMGSGGNLGDSYARALLLTRAKEMKADAEWNKFHMVNSRRVQLRGAYARLFGMFEIPWSEGGGARLEADADVARMVQTVGLLRDTMKTMGNLVGELNPKGNARPGGGSPPVPPGVPLIPPTNLAGAGGAVGVPLAMGVGGGGGSDGFFSNLSSALSPPEAVKDLLSVLAPPEPLTNLFSVPSLPEPLGNWSSVFSPSEADAAEIPPDTTRAEQQVESPREELSISVSSNWGTPLPQFGWDASSAGNGSVHDEPQEPLQAEPSFWTNSPEERTTRVQRRARERSVQAQRVQVIVHAPENEQSKSSENREQQEETTISLSPAMEESRLGVARAKLESIAHGLVGSMKQLGENDPVANAFSAIPSVGFQTVTYRAADGFDHPAVVVQGLRGDRNLLVVEEQVFQELCPTQLGVGSNPRQQLGAAVSADTVVISSNEAGALVGAEQAALQHAENGGDHAAKTRMEEQASEFRVHLAGDVTRELAHLDGRLEFGALKAQNDYLHEFHDVQRFKDDEAITRHIAQSAQYSQHDYLANLVERYRDELFVESDGVQSLSAEFVSRLPGGEIFEREYIKPLVNSAFQFQQERGNELSEWKLVEELNGKKPQVTFDVVRAFGTGLRDPQISFADQQSRQRKLVELLFPTNLDRNSVG